MVRFAFKLAIHGQHTTAKFADMISLAKHAEDVGFDGVFVIDHLMLPGSRLSGYTNAPADRPYFLDAWTSLAAIAASTTRIQLGPQVTPIGLRHPAFVAKWGMTLDQISDGRLLLQVGAGHQEIEYASFGFPYPGLTERVQRLREGIEVIRALWSSEEPANYEGQHYVLKDVPFWPKPVQKLPEIWLGGASKWIRALAPELADGWAPAAPQGGGLDPDFFRDALITMREEAATHGRTLGSGALFYTVIDDDPKKVEERLAVLRRREDWAHMEPSDFRRTGIALAGRPDEVVEAVRRYVDAGLEYLTVGFVPVDDVADAHRGLDLYGEHVIPAFRNA